MFGVDDGLLISALTGLASGAMSLFGGKTQADAAQEAAKIQSGAANDATRLQREQFEQQRADLAPWRQVGEQNLERLNNLAPFEFNPSDLENNPGYQFRLKEGLKAVQNSAATRGGLFSGGTMKSLNNYAQGAASDEYQNAYNRALGTYGTNLNRLQSLAGIGQTAVGAMNSAGQNYANNAGNLAVGGANALAGGYTGAANATASGYVGGANALNNALVGGYNNYQNQQLMNKLFNRRSGTTFPSSVQAPGAGTQMDTQTILPYLG